ncbi:hypothetical protein LOK49_LG11G02843 [Camellia lanceoleosa]|uniref:Uncharacterized protein n=1 Tax=Camellia lanceoleosa TaxID=1840588 RepID=A0ACC0G0U4_9ERIC|nr:hypothetical protein LOK49_LG11G02843 [Camellia lanceoleosa]
MALPLKTPTTHFLPPGVVRYVGGTYWSRDAMHLVVDIDDVGKAWMRLPLEGGRRTNNEAQSSKKNTRPKEIQEVTFCQKLLVTSSSIQITRNQLLSWNVEYVAVTWH